MHGQFSSISIGLRPKNNRAFEVASVTAIWRATVSPLSEMVADLMAGQILSVDELAR